MKKYIALFAFALCLTSVTKAQDDLAAMMSTDASEFVKATFKTTRLNMGHSIETVGAHDLDFRVSHVFGSLGSNYGGGFHNMYGFDQISNIRIAFEYGINSRLTAAVGRSKGFGPQREMWDGYLKYRLIRQMTDKKHPISVTLFGSVTTTSMEASSDSTSPVSFQNGVQRLQYCAQALIARKFNSNFSVQLMPTYLHRNYVAYGDNNDLFAMGFAARYKFSRRSAIIVDFFMPFSSYFDNLREGGKYYNPLGIGYEIETGGHVFHLTIVNTGGLTEQDFLVNSNTPLIKSLDNPAKYLGLRLGFNISRPFTLY